MLLPLNKLGALHPTVRDWPGRVTCTKRGLLSLIACLAFAAEVAQP